MLVIIVTRPDFVTKKEQVCQLRRFYTHHNMDVLIFLNICYLLQIGELVQERRNSIANALEYVFLALTH